MIKNCKWQAIFCACLLFVVIAGILAYFKISSKGFQEPNDVNNPQANCSCQNRNTSSVKPFDFIHGPLPCYKNAAAVTNGGPCSTIAMDILKKGGKAVDAVVAAMFCDGVTAPYAMGLGGGMQMIIYDRLKKVSHSINAGGVCPAGARVDMFHSDADLSKFGGLSISVPGALKGYWTAYQKFGGGVHWKDLIAPTIELCENGIVVNERTATNLRKSEELIKKFPALWKEFSNPKTGELLAEGETYTRPKLAATLRKIAEEGPDVLYNGSLTEGLVNDIKKAGGIITAEDLKSYESRVEDPLVSSLFGKYKMYGVQPPASGVILQFILNIVDNMFTNPHTLSSVQRITEAFKYAFGARSHIADPLHVNISKVINLVTSKDHVLKIKNSISDDKTYQDSSYYTSDFDEPKDHGTGNIVVIAENGDAVVATSSINLHFGSKVLSESTGIILNDGMDGFSSPNITNYFGVKPSEINFIKPFKRSVSSMCPTIITDENGDVILLVGAAGGTHITTTVALAIIRTLIGNETIREAIYNPVFHHQLNPMVWAYESGYSESIVNGMKVIGHKTIELLNTTTHSSTNAIHRKNGVIFATSDYRRPGQIDGY